METQSWPFSAAKRESEPPLSCSFSCWEEKPKKTEKRGFFFFLVLEESCSSASIFLSFSSLWITVLALCRNEKTGSKMPEANYLLSVSWGYIKVCGAYLRSVWGYRTLFIIALCAVLLLCWKLNLKTIFEPISCFVCFLWTQHVT